MTRTVSILGSTGSIGRQTVGVCQKLGIRVKALAASSNIARLERQARLLHPEFIAVYNEDAANTLRTKLADTDIQIGSGISALNDAAAYDTADTVVTAVSGAVGLMPTLAAISGGKRVALANKETLVCAGKLVLKRAIECGAEIIPVDSEHSAIFQCLGTSGHRHLKRILLTASGGPFRGMTYAETYNAAPEQALKHPNWNMGAKISVDSATMMNKGLEFIEAMHLFSMSPDQIKVLIHPQSVVHSMVEYMDGSVIAQLGAADMSLPISYALAYPDRVDTGIAAPDFTALGGLTFEEPDLVNTPCLRIAMECANRGGTAPVVMNAANEVAVGMYLEGKIKFGQIYERIIKALESIDITNAYDLDAILEADTRTRSYFSF